MKRTIYIAYLIYLVFVIAASIFLPIDNFFSVEYVLLGLQALLALVYYLILNRGNRQGTKNNSEFSLIVTVLFVGILYYATLHLLVIALSALTVGGWFLVNRKEAID